MAKKQPSRRKTPATKAKAAAKKKKSAPAKRSKKAATAAIKKKTTRARRSRSAKTPKKKVVKRVPVVSKAKKTAPKRKVIKRAAARLVVRSVPKTAAKRSVRKPAKRKATGPVRMKLTPGLSVAPAFPSIGEPIAIETVPAEEALLEQPRPATTEKNPDEDAPTNWLGDGPATM